jgi:hypothetical protein
VFVEWMIDGLEGQHLELTTGPHAIGASIAHVDVVLAAAGVMQDVAREPTPLRPTARTTLPPTGGGSEVQKAPTARTARDTGGVQRARQEVIQNAR